ncbi:hypothetical protein [Clostridium sp. HCS.1]|uniref:hypothetical protein n=1 Tax=Clostridium sp. HCS.1 TaxID=3238594 RepID=UPI003A0FC692
MKIILLGIATILLGISLILVSSGSASALGLIISFIGFILCVFGTFINERK